MPLSASPTQPHLDVKGEWLKYVGPLAGTAERLVNKLHDPKDEAQRKELYRFMFTQLSAGYVALAYTDPKYPDFWPLFSKVFDALFPIPDTVYHFTPIEDDGAYRLYGYRNSVFFVDFQIGSGKFLTYGQGSLQPNLASHDIDSLSLDEKGAFEVILSPRRPEGYTGDWWELKKGAEHLFIRQYAYDWDQEIDARIGIERLDTPALRPCLDKAVIDRQLSQIANWVDNWVETSMDWTKRHQQAKGVNEEFLVTHYSDGGLQRQRYTELVFDIKADEALIIEAELEEDCTYWSFQVVDEWIRAIDQLNRLSHVNGRQAYIDKDGKFRAVLSLKDPGVPNWLDTGDKERGMVSWRRTDCTRWPSPTVKKVRFAEIRNHLPQDTPVVSPSMREEQIRKKRRAFQLRRVS